MGPGGRVQTHPKGVIAGRINCTFIYTFNFQFHCSFPSFHFNCLHAQQKVGGGGNSVIVHFFYIPEHVMFKMFHAKKGGGGLVRAYFAIKVY